MFQNIKTNLKQASLKDFLFLIFLSSTIGAFLVVNSDSAEFFITNSAACLKIFFLIIAIVFCLWLFFLSNIDPPSLALKYTRLSFAPAIVILLLLIPYSFFYTQLGAVRSISCLAILFLGAVICNTVLKNDSSRPASLPWIIGILLVVYVVYFSVLSVLRHFNYQNASPFDVALYSQIQWNNIHGHFFHSSISGSNFVTHNSPFLILLAPFYALYPHPENLLVLKTVFLASSAIPFYLILKQLVDEKAILPLMLGYLFFPFMVGQNFNAPHEMCFLPPFLLFSFYFYLTNRFKSFLIFLLFSLSIKEHMALISIMYGLYSIYLKREKQWIILPIILGIVWAIFSIWIIYYFQQIYHTDPYPAWLMDNIKRRFMQAGSPVWPNLLGGLKTSNLGHWGNFFVVYLLFSPLGIIVPFFSSISLLGMPELMINFLASLPLTYPTWHYNIVASSFLLIACADTVKKSSSSVLVQKLKLTPHKIQEFFSWFLCICILSHFFLWWDYTHIERNPRYVETMNRAIQFIPKGASVSLTKHLVAYVSDRKDYFLCEDRRKGDYIVLDRNEKMTDCFKDKKQSRNYVEIYRQGEIRVYKNTSGS